MELWVAWPGKPLDRHHGVKNRKSEPVSHGFVWGTSKARAKSLGAVPFLPQGFESSQEGKEGMGGEMLRKQRDRTHTEAGL